MVTRRQLRNSDRFAHEDDLGDEIRQLGNEPDRSSAVSGKPIDHPGVGGMIVCLPRRPICVGVQMRVGEASGVVVFRIAIVSVVERRLRKGYQQAGGNAEMD